jgi:uncharacterized small protein (DUF1192 family)
MSNNKIGHFNETSRNSITIIEANEMRGQIAALTAENERLKEELLNERQECCVKYAEIYGAEFLIKSLTADKRELVEGIKQHRKISRGWFFVYNDILGELIAKHGGKE